MYEAPEEVMGRRAPTSIRESLRDMTNVADGGTVEGGEEGSKVYATGSGESCNERGEATGESSGEGTKGGGEGIGRGEANGLLGPDGGLSGTGGELASGE